MSDRLMYAVGLHSPGPWSCNKMAPKLTGLASVTTRRLVHLTESKPRPVRLTVLLSRIWMPLCVRVRVAERLSLPPPLIQCCLEGLRFHQGNIGGKATLIRRRGEQICRGKWFSRSKFSFVLKCLNGFVRDCSVGWKNPLLASVFYLEPCIACKVSLTLGKA